MRLKDASAYNIQFDAWPADPDRHPLVRGGDAHPAVARLPPVLRALPGAAGPDRLPRPALRPDAARLHRRHPRRPGRAPPARPDATGPRAARPPAPPRRRAAPQPGRCRPAADADRKPSRRMSRDRPGGMLDSLRRTVEGLRWKPVRPLGGVRPTRPATARPARRRRRASSAMLAAVGATQRSGTWAPTLASTATRPSRPVMAGVIAFDQDASSVEHIGAACRRGPRTGPAAGGDLTNPQPGAGLGARGARLVPDPARTGRPGPGPGTGPPPGDRQQRAAAGVAALFARIGAEGDRRVRARRTTR